MAIMAVSGISSLGPDPSEQQSATKQNAGGLGTAISGVNTAKVTVFGAPQGAHSSGAQVNGIRAAASDNPAYTLRVDLQHMQDALNSGDLPAAQQALVRIIQDTQQIASAQQAAEARPGGQAPSALPNASDEQQHGMQPSNAANGKGNLIDVTA
jgi:hypothetical protein